MLFVAKRATNENSSVAEFLVDSPSVKFNINDTYGILSGTTVYKVVPMQSQVKVVKNLENHGHFFLEILSPGGRGHCSHPGSILGFHCSRARLVTPRPGKGGAGVQDRAATSVLRPVRT